MQSRGGYPAIEGPESTDVNTETPAPGHSAGWDVGVPIEETDDGFVVLANLPGFNRNELSPDRQRRTLAWRHTRGRRRASYHDGVLEVRFVVEPEDGSGTDGYIE